MPVLIRPRGQFQEAPFLSFPCIVKGKERLLQVWVAKIASQCIMGVFTNWVKVLVTRKNNRFKG